MEKIIRVGDYEFKAKSTAASFITYKREFGKDAMQELMRFAGSTSKIDVDNPESLQQAICNGGFDIETFMRFAWVFAKSADKSIPPMTEWLESFEVPPFDFVAAVLPAIQGLLFSQTNTTVIPKKK